MNTEEYISNLIREARRSARTWISHNVYIATLLKDLADKLEEYIAKYQLALENNVKDAVTIKELNKSLDATCYALEQMLPEFGRTKDEWREWYTYRGKAK